MPEPIKRHQDLQPISREHHNGLLLSWKIREGFKLNVGTERIKKYVDWFWTNHLKQHFKFEEQFILPILPKDNPLVKKTLREHRRLKSLFESQIDIEKNLSLIEEELVAHIRFEERILFNEIQSIATVEEMQMIAAHHQLIPSEEWADEFWVTAR